MRGKPEIGSVGVGTVNPALKYGLIALLCVLPALFTVTPANAVSWERRGPDGKVCRVLVAPHIHVGVGDNAATKRAARASAVSRWRSFTIWEYGKAWGNTALAKHKSYQCAHLLIGWNCLFFAQPCRR